ncbi:MAG: SMC-Scp complex subunit ScpB [Rhizobium sp.]|nr:SMC-Scp complex subunit ScpB [Rhizobium sp.]
MIEPDAGNDNREGPSPADLVASDAARIVEALVFASSAPVSVAYLTDRVPAGANVEALLLALRAFYAPRGVNLVCVDGHWAFRTASDLAFVLRNDQNEVRKLSRAALEVLAIIAYHQPVTRAEIEDIRGVQTSKGTLDVLLEAGWVRFRGRRRTPGRPVTFGTTRDFLDHFGLEEIRDLPGLEELKAAGMLSGRIPASLSVPIPRDDDLGSDEDPITQLDLEELGLLTPGGEEEE